MCKMSGKFSGKVFSFDAETNGLRGKAFSIGAIVYEDGIEVNRFVGRCPIEGDVNPWVAENVLPKMVDIAETYSSYGELLKAFIQFYMENKNDAVCLVHMGVPVESRILWDAQDFGFMGDFDGPYPLVDCSALPEINTSVDTYNQQNGIKIPSFDGGTHNPLYDSASAALAYMHWVVTH